MDRKVVNILNAMPERDRFIRGLRAWAGFRQTGIPYVRDAGSQRFLEAPELLQRDTAPLPDLCICTRELQQAIDGSQAVCWLMEQE